MNRLMIILVLSMSIFSLGHAAEEPALFQPAGFYQLKNGSACLARKAKVREVELQECDVTVPYQLWRFDPITYKERKRLMVRDKPADTCLEVSAGSSVDGGGVAVWSCSPKMNNQFWEVVPGDDGTYRLRVDHSKKCLMVKEILRKNETTPRSYIVQWACDTSAGQAWQLESEK